MTEITAACTAVIIVKKDNFDDPHPLPARPSTCLFRWITVGHLIVDYTYPRVTTMTRIQVPWSLITKQLSSVSRPPAENAELNRTTE